MTGMKACAAEARHIFVAMQIVVPDELPSTEMMQLVRDVHTFQLPSFQRMSVESTAWPDCLMPDVACHACMQHLLLRSYLCCEDAERCGNAEG